MMEAIVPHKYMKSRFGPKQAPTPIRAAKGIMKKAIQSTKAPKYRSLWLSRHPRGLPSSEGNTKKEVPVNMSTVPITSIKIRVIEFTSFSAVVWYDNIWNTDTKHAKENVPVMKCLFFKSSFIQI